MIEIRPMRPAEAAAARRVIYTVAYQLFQHKETFEETVRLYETTWPLPDVLDFQDRYLASGGVFLVAMDGEEIVGTGALRFLEDGVGEIKRLWLLPAYHGQGLGYRLMDELIQAARRQGYHTLRLETSPSYQIRAFAFYKRLGFREIPRYGDDPDDVGMELQISEASGQQAA